MYISRVLFSDQINARAFRTVVVYTKNNTSLSTFSRGPEDTSHDPFYKTLNSYESHVRINTCMYTGRSEFRVFKDVI